MNIIIPMAGAGKRFSDAGYMVHKPVIMTTYWRTGEKMPMVVCATKDLPGVEADGSNVIYIDRTFHKESGVEEEIRKYFPRCSFITVKELTEGQACTCLLAKEKINTEEELLIAGCDNGMVMNVEDVGRGKNQKADVLAFTYRHNEAVNENPNAYGWIQADEEGHIKKLSIKKPLSDTPINDHAIVATFWFRRGKDFVQAAEKMIAENNRINGEFYVDEVMKHTIELGMDTRVMEVERYIGWGTPRDYENYERTLAYWKGFVMDKGFLPGV